MSELLTKIQELNDEDNYYELIELVEALPKTEQTAEMIGLLGRAYNNICKYEKAEETLLSIKDEMNGDRVWNYRLGYAYYYMGKFEEAIECFKVFLEAEPEDEHVLWFVKHAGYKIEERANIAEYQKANGLPWLASEHKGEEPFTNFDIANFWEEDVAKKATPPSAEAIAEVERELGYKLPESYIKFMSVQNGGYSNNNVALTKNPTTWSGTHVVAQGFVPIAKESEEMMDSIITHTKFMVSEWGYPEIGIAIADTPTAGHDLIFLDYRECGKDGEPKVSHVDQEVNYRISVLAENFEEFIRNLFDEETFDEIIGDYDE